MKVEPQTLHGWYERIHALNALQQVAERLGLLSDLVPARNNMSLQDILIDEVYMAADSIIDLGGDEQ